MCHTTGGDTKNYSLKLKSVAHKPAGSPHLRASQDLLPGAPTKRGAAYLPYLERPTKPTSRGGGVHHTYQLFSWADGKAQNEHVVILNFGKLYIAQLLEI